ncbi:hypothetical protein NDU88_000646 [Pleurodeles waltl]|uniref:Uncharacterized protein n=1 Tax=Pleurodeles waltl TaxID=8319 RepID=A0AAV7VXY9_PLEWA|nr:hypothetical protein NDU88_000646 [Pleurodeles waltl]
MLAWLLRWERPIPIILTIRGLSGENILGQLRVNLHLREHLLNIYVSPQSVDGSLKHEHLDRLWMPRHTDAQVGELGGGSVIRGVTGGIGGYAVRKRARLRRDTS